MGGTIWGERHWGALYGGCYMGGDGHWWTLYGEEDIGGTIWGEGHYGATLHGEWGHHMGKSGALKVGWHCIGRGGNPKWGEHTPAANKVLEIWVLQGLPSLPRAQPAPPDPLPHPPKAAFQQQQHPQPFPSPSGCPWDAGKGGGRRLCAPPCPLDQGTGHSPLSLPPIPSLQVTNSAW